MLLLCAAGPVASAAPAAVSDGDKVIDFGVQPLTFPHVMTTEVIRRDRILQSQLARAGWSMRQHPYYKGNDMLQALAEGQLDAAAFGDIPALNAAAGGNVAIVALLKHTFSSVVTRHYTPLADLKGKRIGNGKGSTAHYTLLEGLASVGLSEGDVELVDINVNDMPTALADGVVDAFSAWEPAPTVALARSPDAFVAYRGVNNAYLVLGNVLVQRHPEVARHFVAAVARAIYWMKKNPGHLRQAARWGLDAGTAFTGASAELNLDLAMAIMRQEVLNVPGIPVLPRGEAQPSGRMAKQLAFLQQQGKLPAGVAWPQIARHFAPQLLADVLGRPGRYRVFNFDYER